MRSRNMGAGDCAEAGGGPADRIIHVTCSSSALLSLPISPSHHLTSQRSHHRNQETYLQVGTLCTTCQLITQSYLHTLVAAGCGRAAGLASISLATHPYVVAAVVLGNLHYHPSASLMIRDCECAERSPGRMRSPIEIHRAVPIP